MKTGSKKQTSGEQEQEGVCSWQGCVRALGAGFDAGGQ